MTKITGYRIVRPLGRGGMATVYLAVQESVQREVALKVMSPMLLGEPQFGERFLREARIAAKLRHPNVVQVHDVGVEGDSHYMAMEYLPGGSVLRKEKTTGDMAYALRVTRQIGSALGYAHEKGVIHRDIKPDNILLREDGDAVLTDFGIARSNNVTRMTRTGAIVGTPYYMSPEQARGQTLDGRADLYSLGIVFYELLMGEVPYQADDPLAVGIQHLTAPLPRLPESFAVLQPLLDRMLAKEPEQRFQTGGALAAAIEGLEARLAGPAIASTSPPPLSLRAEPRRSPTPPASMTESAERVEPSLGRLDDVVSTPARRREHPVAERRGLSWVVAILILLGGGTAAWWQQDRLSDWVRGLLPETGVNHLLDQADKALAAGVLATDGNREGAREIYSAVLARDPDNRRGRDGLVAVGHAFLARARAAMQQNQYDEARRLLGLAREMALPANSIDSLAAELSQRENAGNQLAALLQRARSARDAGHLDGGTESAVALYQQALELAPGNAVANAGLDETLAALLQQAQEKIAAGDESGAEASVARVATIKPAHLGIPTVRAALSERQRERATAFGKRLEQAEQWLAQGRLTAPASGNARDAFRALLAEQPDNVHAAAGLRRVGAALVARAKRATADFDFDRSEKLLKEAEAVAPQLASIAQLRQRITTLKTDNARLAAPPETSTAASDPRIAALLEEARTAAAAGRLLSPPGDSAYDKYRAVQALDRHNADAKTGLAALPATAREYIESALAQNQFNQARDYLGALQELAPNDPALPDLRHRLAAALLGHAAERLGAGEIARAAKAFNQASELDPNNPELPAFQARLEQARGG